MPTVMMCILSSSSFFSVWRRVRSNSLFDQQKTMRISRSLSLSLSLSSLFERLFFPFLFAYRKRCSCSLFFLLSASSFFGPMLMQLAVNMVGRNERRKLILSFFFFFFLSFVEQPMFVKQNLSIFTNRKKKNWPFFPRCGARARAPVVNRLHWYL